MNPVPTAPKPKPLLDQVREAVRLKHYSRSTEDTYHNWVKRFILFHNRRHPKDMGAPEITAFLTHLAVEENVAASTQRQALSAIIFLYREVLQQELEALPDVVRAKQPQRLPVVLTKAEVQAVLRHVPNEYQVMAKLLYGSGLRLMECVRLRVKDLDFAQQLIVVRDGKGMKDRVTTSRRLSPTNCAPPWKPICCKSNICILRIWNAVTARCICPLRWNGNTPRRRARRGPPQERFLP